MKVKYIIFTILATFMMVACDVIPESDRIGQGPERIVSLRKVLLLDFTGQKCPNCPDAAAIISDLLTAYPRNVVAVGMYPDGHGLALPGVLPTSLSTKEAMEYLSFYGTSNENLPCGVVNGKKFDGQYIQQKESWASLVTAERVIEPECLVDLAYVPGPTHKVEVTLTPQYDSIQAALPYDVSLQLWLIESGIKSAQSFSEGSKADYEHNHAFRKCLNPLWGDELGKIAEVTKKEYTFDVDAKFVIDNCAVVAVLINTETKEVVQVGEVALGKATH